MLRAALVCSTGAVPFSRSLIVNNPHFNRDAVTIERESEFRGHHTQFLPEYSGTEFLVRSVSIHFSPSRGRDQGSSR